MIEQAVQTLRQGGVIAYPTESVFGLGCDPDNEDALQKLLQIKQRDPAKGLILVASDFSQLQPYLQRVDAAIAEPAFASWPGPYTWIWPARSDISPLLRGQHASLAVRVSAHPLVQALCHAFAKPIVSTSANVSDQPAAQTTEQVKAIFSSQLDYIVAGETGEAGMATEIRDLITNQLIRPKSNA